MDLTKLIENYQEGATAEQMLQVTKAIAKFVTGHADKEETDKMCRDIYGILSNGHFDECFADGAIRRMYYEDEDGNRHHAPYFTEDEVREVFSLNKDDISDYTVYDLAVTMNMLRSDNSRFLEKYAKNTAEIKEMVTCMAIEYLQDPDAPYPKSKIWHYING